jgi:alpha-ketoglutaric semialdehyde dehydrogenase
LNLAGQNRLSGDHGEGSGTPDLALTRSDTAFRAFARLHASARAQFLRAIADELLYLGDQLLECAHAETALPLARLQAERMRTANQLRLFADHIEEGSWVEARIDTGDPARTPLPKPDVRRMLIPLGPVVVFGASNFPLAFSVAGGDTASAFAAGCTVVFKAHPAHPETSDMVAGAIERAARVTEMPEGVFSLVQGASYEVGLALVRHPLTQAVGFTGSLRGGRAIFDAAAARPSPIPVYAEMGSINPVFLLPSALEAREDSIAQALAQSITLGVGQYCTNPGVVLGVRSQSLERMVEQLAERMRASAPGTMLYDGLLQNYAALIDRARSKGIDIIAAAPAANACAQPMLLATDAARFIDDAELREEMFGPASLIVIGNDITELERVAEAMEGQLTATLYGTDDELREHAYLVETLRRKVGRLIFNGVPTGLEVGHAMQHGGPYPATTDSRSTSVGTAAIARFARPLCYQDFPDAALPVALQNHNTLGIWRMINVSMTTGDV